MKITYKYQVLFGQVQVQVQVLWHFHTPSTQVQQVLINMYLSTSTVLNPNPDWYANITCLMGKVKIKQKLLYPVSHDASVSHDLCSMRDDGFCKMFNKTQLDQLIIDISIN